MDPRKAFLVKKCIPPVAFISALVIAWEFLVVTLKIPRIILPTPLDIYSNGFAAFPDLLLTSLAYTIEESIIGFVLAAIVGICTAIILVHSSLFHSMVYPLMVLTQFIPKSAIAPLFIIWFGFGLESKVAMSFLICYFPIVIDAVAGFVAVPREMLYLVHSLRASATQVFSKVELYYALPHIFSGLKVAITLAMVGAIVGEFVGGATGIGYMIVEATFTARTDVLFACLVLASLGGTILYFGVVMLERLSIPWYGAMRKRE